MGDNFLDLVNIPSFVKSEWIAISKKYPITDTPLEIVWARAKLLKIPEMQAGHLPSPNIPITQFLQIKFPPQSSEIITVKPQARFSNDTPTTDIELLMERPIPPQKFLLKLEGAMGQAWFDGAKSVLDTRFNNSQDHLPLWVISFWKTVVDIVAKQNWWKKCLKWLNNEEGKTTDLLTIQAVGEAKRLLASIGWRQTLPYSQKTVTTIELTSLLSIAWLSDDHINMMVEELSIQLAASDPDLAKRVIIAPLAFSAKLESAAMTKQDSYG
jgi:hypothetical protein